MPVLFLTCGLQASGKTALARQLEEKHCALRLTADEWLCQLFPDLSERELDLHRPEVERLQWAVALRVLRMGGNVVLDWGLWAREERDQYRSEAQAVGAQVVLCLLEPSRQELLDRIERRNADLPAGAFRITRAEFDWAWEFFQRERPTPAELSLFDRVLTSAAVE